MRVVTFCFLSGFLLASISNVTSQNNHASIITQQEQIFLGNQVVLPTNPDAASLGKYGDIQVNNYTGTSNLTFPGPVIQGKQISAPISLSYATSGIKVQDIGSWTGLGMSLVAGGNITCAMRHVPDQRSNYYDHADEIELRQDPPNSGDDLFDWYEFYNKVALNSIETIPDIYYFNFNGRAGKFYISPRKKIIIAEDSDLRIVPDFDANDKIRSFAVFDEQGVRYDFNLRETSTMKLADAAGEEALVQYVYQYTSTWHLTKITSFHANEVIDLNYSTHSDFYRPPQNPALLQSRWFSSSDECCGGEASGIPSIGVLEDVFISNRRTLATIALKINNLEVQKLQFDSSPAGCVYNQSTDRKLDRIKVFKRSLSGTAMNHVMDYLFRYDCSNSRLTLKEFGPVTPNASTYATIPSHKFDYIISSNPPEPTSTSIDHWGYYNGSTTYTTTGPTLVPSFGEPGNNFYYQGADRSTNGNFSDFGSLYKVTYPTGGYSIFEYESNQRTNLDYEYQLVCDGPCFTLSNCSNTNNDCCSISDDYVINDALFTASEEDAINAYIVIDAHTVCDNNDPQQVQSTGSDKNPSLKNHNSATGLVHITIVDPLANTERTLYSNNRVSQLDGLEIPIHDFLMKNTRYRIKIRGIDVFASISIKNRRFTSTASSEDIGGLRIASISNHNSNNELLLKKKYTYNYEDGISSGVLMNEPNYIRHSTFMQYPINTAVTSPCHTYGCGTITVSSSSFETLGTTHGSPIGYSQVTEEVVNANNEPISGKTVFLYHNTSHQVNAFRLDHPRNGKLHTLMTFDDQDNILTREEHQYSFDIMDFSREELYRFYKIEPQPDQDNQFYLYQDATTGHYLWTADIGNVSGANAVPFKSEITKYEHSEYEIIRNYSTYLSAKTSCNYFYDEQGEDAGVTMTVENYIYEDTVHLQPTETSILNSDGKTYSTSYKYLSRYDEQNDAHDETFDSKNKLLPAWETVQKVDNLQVDGQRILFSYYNSSGTTDNPSYLLFPNLIQRYEETWDSDGSLSQAEDINEDGEINEEDKWITRSSIDRYNINVGQPDRIHNNGWNNSDGNKNYVELTWNNAGLLENWKFIDYTSAYSYYDNTHLLSSFVNIDGTSTSYTYDELLRLKTTRDDQRGVETTYTYNYDIGTVPNQIITSTTYPTQGQTGTNVRIADKTIFDGIGRPIQTINHNQGSTATQSIITSIEYDNVGRVWKEYEAIEVGGLSESQFLSQPAYDYADHLTSVTDNYSLTTYEASPLNRIATTTMPDWPASKTYLYGSNSATEVLLNPDVAGNTKYGANLLSKTTIIDENGNKDIIFQDKVGRELLKRRTSSDGTKSTDTYTVYDDKNRIENIYPPGTAPYEDKYADVIYEYTYTGEDLISTKKVPDSEVMNYYYDERDLMVAWQDGNFRTRNKYFLTEYDDYGRELGQGFSHANIQDPTAPFNSINNIRFSFMVYGDAAHNKDKIVDSYYAQIDDDYGASFGGVNRHYEYEVNTGRLMSEQFHHPKFNGFDFPIGWLQGEKPNLQVKSKEGNEKMNCNGIIPTITYTYDSADNLTEKNVSVCHYTGQVPINITKSYDYLKTGNQLNEKFSGGDLSNSVLSTYTYDQKRNLASANLGNLQTVDYEYLPNNFLKSINGTPSDDLFSMQIGYTAVSGDNPYNSQNGNISEITWSTTDHNQKNYYRYDFMDRLTNSYEVSGTTLSANPEVYNYNYSTEIKYIGDGMNNGLRGNIEFIKRTNSVGDLIDNLTFAYPGSNANAAMADDLTSNRISSIQEASNTNLGYTAPNTSAIAYQYDLNGNITHDNRNEVSISYNHLNLPVKIVKDADNDITYDYDASGYLLRKAIRVDGEEISERIYFYDIEFDNGNIDLVQHDNGYLIPSVVCNDNTTSMRLDNSVDKSDGKIFIANSDLISEREVKATGQEYRSPQITLQNNFTIDAGMDMSMMNSTEDCSTSLRTTNYTPQYLIKDHLGNTRVTFKSPASGTDPEILSEHHYYPFGLEMTGQWGKQNTNDYNYRYNGKELQDELGLGYYNYGFRFYDPAIGRFTGVDPMADSPNNNYMTPYHYVANNPINNIDPDGLDWYTNNETGETHWQEGSDDLDGHKNIGSSYTIYGENQTIIHEQNEVVAVIDNVEPESSESSVSGQIMSGTLTAAAVTSQLDSPVPGPADAVALGEIVLGGIAAGLAYLTIDRVYSKTHRGNHRDDGLRDLTDDDIAQELGKLKGRLDKVQKALKRRLQKEQKVRRQRNKQKKNSEHGTGTGRN